MIEINEHFLALQNNYLFSEIAKRVKAYKTEQPDKKLISLGIGDVSLPLPQAVCRAMHAAVDDLSRKESFRGYGPEQGYDFLKEQIVEHDFASRGVTLDKSEIFINDGAKSDTGNITDILGRDLLVAVGDPVYPVYVDSNIMAGRKDSIIYLPCTAENNFVPALPGYRSELPESDPALSQGSPDLIYLCYPNNPTGTTLSKEELQVWVDYARRNHSLILFDAAYEAFIQHEEIPHSIYEMQGAKEVAIEFRSFSKTAGFTGLRCGYTVVPEELVVKTSGAKVQSLNQLWNRRQSTKFNGASYVSQRAAEAVYSPEGRQQVQDNIAYYMANARILRQGLLACGLKVYGGEDAPYLWVKTPDNFLSWEFFELLLQKAALVSTPGVGFGSCGEGYIRFSAFGERESCLEALGRIHQIL